MAVCLPAAHIAPLIEAQDSATTWTIADKSDWTPDFSGPLPPHSAGHCFCFWNLATACDRSGTGRCNKRFNKSSSGIWTQPRVVCNRFLRSSHEKFFRFTISKNTTVMINPRPRMQHAHRLPRREAGDPEISVNDPAA
jgi:hypothetical protein